MAAELMDGWLNRWLNGDQKAQDVPALIPKHNPTIFFLSLSTTLPVHPTIRSTCYGYFVYVCFGASLCACINPVFITFPDTLTLVLVYQGLIQMELCCDSTTDHSTCEYELCCLGADLIILNFFTCFVTKRKHIEAHDYVDLHELTGCDFCVISKDTILISCCHLVFFKYLTISCLRAKFSVNSHY